MSIGVGILAWKSGDVLKRTLESYAKNDLFNIVDEYYILFQECSDKDLKLAEEFNIPAIPVSNNIGIGSGFMQLAQKCDTDFFLPLEHDWHLVEPPHITDLLFEDAEIILRDLTYQDKSINAIRLRSRTNPGKPNFSARYINCNWDYIDPESKTKSPHLIDAYFFEENPEQNHPEIHKEYIRGFFDHDGRPYYLTKAAHAQFTNNPTLYKRDWYIETLKPFSSAPAHFFEGAVFPEWVKWDFYVAAGEGMFKHVDGKKYG